MIRMRNVEGIEPNRGQSKANRVVTKAMFTRDRFQMIRSRIGSDPFGPGPV